MQNSEEMTKENAIRIFEEKKVRSVWDSEVEKWYLSIIDVIEVLTGNERPRKYWDDLKRKLKNEGSELSEKIGQMKMLSADGKMRMTDVADVEQLFRLIQSILNPLKKNSFKEIFIMLERNCRHCAHSILYFISVSVIIVAFSPSILAHNKTRQIDSIVQFYSDNNQFSGCILVAEKDTVLIRKAYGYANREWDVLNTIDTKFRIASITKQFTAVLIMQLVNSGIVNLNSPITDYLPYYRKDTGNKITIKHLLSHTSGLREYTSSFQVPDFYKKIYGNKYSTREFIENFCSDDLYFEPGSEYLYSNEGYYILGAIIEEKTNKKYEEVLKERILDLIGMSNTAMEKEGDIIKQFANGYSYIKGKYYTSKYIDPYTTLYSAGALYSTIDDLYLWDRALFTNTLLPKSCLNSMIEPNSNNYTYGFKLVKAKFPEVRKEVMCVYHDGEINGFHSLIVHVIESEIVIVILSNTFESDIKSISREISCVLYGVSNKS